MLLLHFLNMFLGHDFTLRRAPSLICTAFAVQQGIVKPQAHANAQPNEYRGTLDVLRIAGAPSEYDGLWPAPNPALHPQLTTSEAL